MRCALLCPHWCVGVPPAGRCLSCLNWALGGQRAPSQGPVFSVTLRGPSWRRPLLAGPRVYCAPRPGENPHSSSCARGDHRAAWGLCWSPASLRLLFPGRLGSPPQAGTMAGTSWDASSCTRAPGLVHGQVPRACGSGMFDVLTPSRTRSCAFSC